MPEYVTLEEAKLHLKVEHDEEDLLINSYIDAGEEAVVRECLDFGEVMPSPLKAAVLLYVADLYANRELQFPGVRMSTSTTIDRLIGPYRKVGI